MSFKKENSREAKLIFFSQCIIRVTKHNHLQLQLRISRQWFTSKPLLNTMHLNLMGRVKLFDNLTSRVSKSKQIRSPNENIYLHTYSYTYLLVGYGHVLVLCISASSNVSFVYVIKFS